jgi:putative flippase GtrA
VEAAVVHNFLWHERFTWADRTGRGITRFVKFNLTTGTLSIAGNLVLMKLLAGFGHMNYLVANGITITTCSVVDFLVSDGFVFTGSGAKSQSM